MTDLVPIPIYMYIEGSAPSWVDKLLGYMDEDKLLMVGDTSVWIDVVNARPAIDRLIGIFMDVQRRDPELYQVAKQIVEEAMHLATVYRMIKRRMI